MSGHIPIIQALTLNRLASWIRLTHDRQITGT